MARLILVFACILLARSALADTASKEVKECVAKLTKEPPTVTTELLVSGQVRHQTVTERVSSCFPEAVTLPKEAPDWQSIGDSWKADMTQIFESFVFEKDKRLVFFELVEQEIYKSANDLASAGKVMFLNWNAKKSEWDEKTITGDFNSVVLSEDGKRLSVAHAMGDGGFRDVQVFDGRGKRICRLPKNKFVGEEALFSCK